MVTLSDNMGAAEKNQSPMDPQTVGHVWHCTIVGDKLGPYPDAEA